MGSTHRLKVGVDFGTTYSGVAWAHTGSPKDVFVLREWPGGTRTSDKVPSEISYTDAGEVDKWGFEIKPSAPRVVWFKLLLDPTKYASTHSSTIVRTNRLIPGSKKPVDVVTDYLTCLRKHTLKILERTYGKAFLDVTPIDYCMTVPAIWNDAAKALTLQAAESAGFGNRSAIRLVSEPEAAAAWSLMKDIQPINIKVNDTFVVVDCGGGTVDLISYNVVAIEPNLEVKECVVGSGALCGSTFLNQRFEDLVKSRIKQKFEKMREGSRNIMMKHFEEFLKRSFSNSEDDDIFSCPIPGIADDPAAGVEDGCFVLTRDEMKDIFDTVINKIIQLVREQIKAAESSGQRNMRISSILLVGGFGASKYLLQRLEADMSIWRRRSTPVQILQPANAWSAVARGAVLRALEGSILISSRKARRHYGTECCGYFKFGEDPFEKLIYCQYTGEPLCKNTMQYYVKLGEQVSEDTPILLPFIRSVGISSGLAFTEKLFECEDLIAPRFTTDTPVKSLCTFTSNLSTVPKHLFTKKKGINGQDYYEISYNLVMTMQSAQIVFHLEFQGKKYGSVSVKYGTN